MLLFLLCVFTIFCYYWLVAYAVKEECIYDPLVGYMHVKSGTIITKFQFFFLCLSSAIIMFLPTALLMAIREWFFG